MDKSFYTKVTGDTITAGRFTLATLRLTHRLGLRRLFSFVYRHFTEEGKRWKRMLALSAIAETAIMERVGSNDTLRRFDRKMEEHVEVAADRKTWWVLFEVFTDVEMTYMVQDFLSHNRREDFQTFGRTCTVIARQVLNVSVVSDSQGAVLREPEYIRAVAIQQLAACFASFPSLRRTEEQIRHHIRAY